MTASLRLVNFKNFAAENVPCLFVKGDHRIEYMRGWAL